MTGQPGVRFRVVVADDSSDLRWLVRRRLEASGRFVVVGEAGDGDAAVALVVAQRPDLLLLDISMPRCDGIEAIPGIVAVRPSTAVVVFSGFHEEDLADRVRQMGADDMIEKSLPLSHLPDRLLAILEAPSLGGERRSSSLVLVESPSWSEDEQQVLDDHVAQFQDLFDRAAIGMATLTLTGTVVHANPALARLMSCTPRDLVGIDYGRLTEGAGDQLDRALSSLGNGRNLAAFEHRVPAAVAEPSRTVRVTLAPIRDADERLLYVFAQVQDISALRAAQGDLRLSEEHFRLLVDAVTEYAVFMLDTQGNVISWNAGAERIKGYTPAEIVGRHFRVFYPPEEQTDGHPERNLEAALREGELAEEGWRLRKDGQRFWGSVVITPTHDEEGRHTGFVKITRDQSGQRRHEEERRESLAQQVELLALTAHELRTPAAVVKGSAEALVAEWQEMGVERRDELLDSIRSSAHRLERLALDLATASRLRGGTLRFTLEDVSLRSVLDAAVARRTALGRDGPVSLDFPRDQVVHVDAGRVGQALDNLLDNAARHGRPPVALTASVEQRTMSVSVTDHGPGVPPRLVAALFGRFAKAGPRGGTGLGLYLVQEIALAHGGTVAYDPPGDGSLTRFTLRLPSGTGGTPGGSVAGVGLRTRLPGLLP